MRFIRHVVRAYVVIAAVAVLSTALWCQGAAGPKFGGSELKEAAARTPSAAPHVNVADSFVVGPDDILAINVWNETEITRSVTVRPDGKISVALIGELQASGKTPQQLEREITSKLSSFVTDPTVTVIVQEIRSRKFSVLGKVTHPGSYSLTNTTTVLDAIALAGGFRDFAKQKAIYVLRQKSDGSAVRLAFDYKEVVKGNKLEQNVRLEPRDTVVVP
jgi:polysaccharide biosynthesis/export protein